MKSSTLLARLGWLSVFAEGWLILLRLIPADKLTWIFFTVFFVVAVMASAVSSPSKKDGIASPDDLIVKRDNQIYTQDNGMLLIGPERQDGKMVVIIQKQSIFHGLDQAVTAAKIIENKK